MDFEFEISLRDGRVVNAVGVADVTYGCDCCEGRDHIEEIHVESAVLIVNDESWLEIERSPAVLAELDSKIESKLYRELEGVA
jgi:hypothetical protein